MGSKTPIAINLRVAMARRDVGSKDLAQRLGVSASTITAWRSGKRIPPYQMVCQLATILEREVHWFYMEHRQEAAA